MNKMYILLPMFRQDKENVKLLGHYLLMVVIVVLVGQYIYTLYTSWSILSFDIKISRYLWKNFKIQHFASMNILNYMNLHKEMFVYY